VSKLCAYDTLFPTPPPRVEAVESARCVIAEDIRNGQPIVLSDAIEIAGTDGLTVSTVPFSEVMSIRAK
jgi:hypothetical protein